MNWKRELTLYQTEVFFRYFGKKKKLANNIFSISNNVFYFIEVIHRLRYTSYVVFKCNRFGRLLLQRLKFTFSKYCLTHGSLSKSYSRCMFRVVDGLKINNGKSSFISKVLSDIMRLKNCWRHYKCFEFE